jgi:tRNA G46 methylase TrmB
MNLNVSDDINPEDDLMSVETYIKILYAAVCTRGRYDLQNVRYILERSEYQNVQVTERVQISNTSLRGCFPDFKTLDT